MSINKILLAIAILAIAGCKKSNDSKPANNISTAPNNADLYIAGNINGKAAIWKNGVPTLLSPDSINVVANSIAVQGNDVYVAGYYTAINKFKGQYYVACYWKNGVITPLSFTTDPTNQFASYGGQALGIAVNGNDIYVIGCDIPNGLNTASYWKNGVITHLDNIIFDLSEATGIAIQGGNVYISGYEQSNGAVYWKNGAITILKSNHLAVTKGIMIDGDNNVYVVGNDVADRNAYLGVYVPAFWENGVETILPNNINNTTDARGMALQGTNVVVAGNVTTVDKPYNKTAVYWKNSTIANLTTDSSLADVFGITTQGNDIYVVGDYTFGPYTFPSSNITVGYATYWKNGEAVQVSKSPSTAYAILIVPH